MAKERVDGPIGTIKKLKRLLILLIGIGVLLSVAMGALWVAYGSVFQENPEDPVSQQSHAPGKEEKGVSLLPVVPQTTPVPGVKPEESLEPEEGAVSPPKPIGESGMPETQPDIKKDMPPPKPADNRFDSRTGALLERKEAASRREAPDNKENVKLLFWVLAGLLAVDLTAVLAVSLLLMVKMRELRKKADPQMQVPGVAVGKIHSLGARRCQEDSLGCICTEGGVLAVVADGMGGLAGGDKVSRKIVDTMLAQGADLPPNPADGVLAAMVQETNSQVNSMLGPSGIYKSGSTLLAVLVDKMRLHWIAVGDSRIYLYRNGQMRKLNQEHTLGSELLRRAERGEISYAEVKAAPRKERLTSFIGMGALKYVDKSSYSLPLEPGDRVLLMTDGVFNALPEAAMAAVLAQKPDVRSAAAEMEHLILQKAVPKQDNFSAIILGL